MTRRYPVMISPGLCSIVTSSAEGVQVGGVQSPFGVLGIWTTVHHEAIDPVGRYLGMITTIIIQLFDI